MNIDFDTLPFLNAPSSIKDLDPSLAFGLVGYTIGFVALVFIGYFLVRALLIFLFD